MVNRTNNALECYNKRFTLLEFVQILEKETRFQAQQLQDIRTGKCCEVHCENMWVPEISIAYYHFKNSMSNPVEAISTPTKTNKGQKKRNKKKSIDKETVPRTPKLVDKEGVPRSHMKEQNGRPNKRITKKP